MARVIVQCSNCRSDHEYVNGQFVYDDEIVTEVCVNCGMDLEAPTGARRREGGTMTTIFGLHEDERAMLEARLDTAYIETIAANVRARREQDIEVCEIAYMPGNATHYALFLGWLAQRPVQAAGGGSAGQDALPYFGAADTLLVWAQQGTMVAFERSTLRDSFDNVAEALGGTAADQVAIAALLREVAHG